MTAQPALDEFRRLAASHRVVPVWREVLADLTTPVSAFARVVGDDEGFLLESVEGGDRWSRWSFMGRRPHGTLVSKDSTLRVIGDLGVDIPTDQGMLAALELLLDHYRAPEIDGLPPLARRPRPLLPHALRPHRVHLPGVRCRRLGRRLRARGV